MTFQPKFCSQRQMSLISICMFVQVFVCEKTLVAAASFSGRKIFSRCPNMVQQSSRWWQWLVWLPGRCSGVVQQANWLDGYGRVSWFDDPLSDDEPDRSNQCRLDDCAGPRRQHLGAFYDSSSFVNLFLSLQLDLCTATPQSSEAAGWADRNDSQRWRVVTLNVGPEVDAEMTIGLINRFPDG